MARVRKRTVYSEDEAGDRTPKISFNEAAEGAYKVVKPRLSTRRIGDSGFQAIGGELAHMVADRTADVHLFERPAEDGQRSVLAAITSVGTRIEPIELNQLLTEGGYTWRVATTEQLIQDDGVANAIAQGVMERSTAVTLDEALAKEAA